MRANHIAKWLLAPCWVPIHVQDICIYRVYTNVYLSVHNTSLSVGVLYSQMRKCGYVHLAACAHAYDMDALSRTLSSCIHPYTHVYLYLCAIPSIRPLLTIRTFFIIYGDRILEAVPPIRPISKHREQNFIKDKSLSWNAIIILRNTYAVIKCTSKLFPNNP